MTCASQRLDARSTTKAHGNCLFPFSTHLHCVVRRSKLFVGFIRKLEVLFQLCEECTTYTEIRRKKNNCWWGSFALRHHNPNTHTRSYNILACALVGCQFVHRRKRSLHELHSINHIVEWWRRLCLLEAYHTIPRMEQIYIYIRAYI